MAPPTRLESATFGSYEPRTPSQQTGKEILQAFVAQEQKSNSWWQKFPRFFSQQRKKRQGLYLVGPVGTGKSHLLAAAYNALEPEISCSFIHMSTISRLTISPRAYGEMLARESEVVCLDELEIDDAANEARVVTILTVLESKNISLLASSNVTPGEFMTTETGAGRFSSFLRNHFDESYEIVWMKGKDFRMTQSSTGYAWIGSEERATEKMKAHHMYRRDDTRWLDFDLFLERSEATPHRELIAELASHDALYLEAITIKSSDDALRLLRVIDDLYTAPDPPDLYFTSDRHPDQWLPEGQNGAAQAVSTKFRRTISRVKALCTIERVASTSSRP